MTYTLREHGFEMVPSVLDRAQIEGLREELAILKLSPGHRNLAGRIPSVAALAETRAIIELLARLVEGRPLLVRSIFFDKTPEANWLVPWHQDLTITVRERREIPGYGPWSTKDGVVHVQPPLNILESIVTLRFHLDDCDETSGALKVIPNTHRRGRFSAADIAHARENLPATSCSARAGDVLAMRPLLLHASSAAVSPAHRRVIHLEFAVASLAEDLHWAEATDYPQPAAFASTPSRCSSAAVAGRATVPSG